MNTISKADTLLAVKAFTITAILLLSSAPVLAEANPVQCQQDASITAQQQLQRRLRRDIEQLVQQKIDLQIEHTLQQFAQQQEQQINAWLAKSASKQTDPERTIESQSVDTTKIKLVTK